MNPYLPIVSLHAIVAVVGVGLFGAIPVVASAGRRAEVAAPVKARAIESLFPYTQWSLVLMLLTGVLLDVVARGTFHSRAWFRVSAVLFVFLGFAHARARAGLRKGLDPGGDVVGALRRVARWGWTMCLTVALITVLMEVKPF